MKYVAGFGYIDKILIVLSATSGGLCIIFSVSVVGVPIGIAGASFTLIFSLTGFSCLFFIMLVVFFQ